MYSICKINGTEILFGPCPSQIIPLADSVQSYINQGIDIVISLLEEEEQKGLGLEMERTLCEEMSILFFNFPIIDMSIPSLNQLSQNIELFYGHTFTKKRMYIHCRHGIGRSALITASLMVRNGMDIKQSLDTIAKVRGMNVPETLSQKKLLSAYNMTLTKQ